MRQLPKLDKRLSAAAAMVRKHVRCADIGCDHGYLITWLLADDRISFGYACDIHKKPLEKAAFTLAQYRVTDRARCLLCDGLSGLKADEVDDIVIAGMGGETIWQIINSQAWTKNPHFRFILQPMTRAEQLRRYLYENGFQIKKELAVVAGDFPYTVMQVCYTGECKTISDAFAWCGMLLNDQNEDARRYVHKTVDMIRVRANGLSKTNAEPAIYDRYVQLLHQLERNDIQ